MRRRNTFMLFILAAAAIVVIAAVFFLLPETPEEVEATLASPVFSHVTGIYEGPLTLTLQAQPGSTIHYTLDGSTPNTESPVYREPLIMEGESPASFLHIPSTSDELYPEWGYDRYQWKPPLGEWTGHPVVRAMAVNEEGEISPVAGHTYLMGEDAAPLSEALPLVFLITDPDGLFSEENGIYVPGSIFHQWRTVHPEERVLGNSPANYNERGREWERDTHLAFLEPDGTVGFVQNTGLRIHGGFTRAWAQKSLRLYARASYDETDWLEYPLFPGHVRSGDGTPMNRYKRILLRNSGNDWTYTMFRDALMHRLVEDLRLDSQAVRPAVVYLNGEYWGIHHIRERLDEYYLSEHYGIAEEALVLINEREWEAEVGDSRDVAEFRQHMDRITGFFLTEEERFHHASSVMDMEHWYEYLTAQLYAANTDWIANNMRVWRKRTLVNEPEAPYGHDGRWRWIFFDIDYAFDFLGYGYRNHDTISWLAEESPLFERLSRSETFRNQFAGRMADLLNTIFRSDHVQGEADAFTRILAPEMPRNIQRWPQFGDMGEWHHQVQVIHDFAAERPDILRQHTADYFSLQGSVPVEIKLPPAHQGQMRFNTLSPETVQDFSDRDGYFRGEVFLDVPLELEAYPLEGWAFSHWEGTGLEEGWDEKTITILPETALVIESVFARKQ